MTNTTKLMTKLAVAIGLIGSLAFSGATPSLAHSRTGAFATTTARAQVVAKQRTSRPVYQNGQYVGSDPDRFIRDMLRQDPPGDYN